MPQLRGQSLSSRKGSDASGGQSAEMSQTRIFVSSTYFYLAQVRDDIRQTLISLGHVRVMREKPSFPDLQYRIRSKQLEPLPEFSAESRRANEIALERPELWEYLLSAELLQSRIGVIRERLRDIRRGLAAKLPSRMIDQYEFMRYVEGKL